MKKHFNVILLVLAILLLITTRTYQSVIVVALAIINLIFAIRNKNQQ